MEQCKQKTVQRQLCNKVLMTLVGLIRPINCALYAETETATNNNFAPLALMNMLEMDIILGNAVYVNKE